MTPTVYLYDEDDNEIEHFEIGDNNLEEITEALAEHGFNLRKPVVEYPDSPKAKIKYGGHDYWVYDVFNFHDSSRDFATSLKDDQGQSGYMATLHTPGEARAVTDILSRIGVPSAWLGASDSDVEGEWKWTSDDLHQDPDKRFFYLGSSDGATLPGLYSQWKPGEPNNAGDEDCAILTAEGWNDVPCIHEKSALVVEFGDHPVVDPPENLDSRQEL